MPILFNQPGQEREFYRIPLTANDLHSSDLFESRESIGLQHAQMDFRNWCFDGYRLAHSALGQQSETTYAIRNDIDALKIYFNRRGRSRFDYKQLSKSYTVGSGQFNMLYAAELDSRISHIDANSEIFSLQLTRETFEALVGEDEGRLGRFADRIGGKQPHLFSDHWLAMSPAMEKCIHEILDCPFDRDLKKIYLQSKAVELFVLFAHACRQSRTVAEFVKTTVDRDKLFAAKEYLLRHYADPISLSALGKVSGLNEFKLKRGFKELFGTSVIDFLINYRLEKAVDLLLRTDKTISEIAYETGYASPSYFSKAFSKKFGKSPRQSLTDRRA